MAGQIGAWDQARRIGDHGRAAQRGLSVVELLLVIVVFSVFLAAQRVVTQGISRQDVSEAVAQEYAALGASVAAQLTPLGVTGAVLTPVTAAAMQMVGAIPAEMIDAAGTGLRPDANGTVPTVFANAAGAVMVIGGPASASRVQSGFTRGQLFLIGETVAQCGTVAPPCAYGAAARGVSSLPAGTYATSGGAVYYGWHN